MDDLAAHGARDAPRCVVEAGRRGKWIRPARVVVAAWAAAFYGVGAPSAQPARFPPVDRPVAPIISPPYSTEAERDRHREAERVMNRLGVTPGMRVADIGAGDGYYTVRLAKRLGHGATIYAEDVSQPYLDRLAARLTHEGVAGVTLVHGTPPVLLRCELGAVGYRQIDFLSLAPADGYLAVFARPEVVPRPEAIQPCRR